MSGYKLNLRALVDDLGGPTACRRRLAALGIVIAPRTMNKWLERDDIAAVYLVNLMAHHALNEGPLDLNRYIVRPGAAGLRLVRERRPAPPATAPGS